MYVSMYDSQTIVLRQVAMEVGEYVCLLRSTVFDRFQVNSSVGRRGMTHISHDTRYGICTDYVR